MSFIKKGLLDIKPLTYEARRFRNINIQKPRKPHFPRQVVIDVCKPKIPPKTLNKCQEHIIPIHKIPVENPFEAILAKECLNWFNHSKMVIFLHANPYTNEDIYTAFTDLKLENMHLKGYNKKVVFEAIQDTPYEVCYKLFTSQSRIVFSQDVKVQKFLKIMKKAPQLVILAGIVDGKLLTKNEIVAYGKLPSLDVARAQLCHVLSSAGSHLVQQMAQAQLSLVSNLDQHSRGPVEVSEPEKTEDSP